MCVCAHMHVIFFFPGSGVGGEVLNVAALERRFGASLGNQSNCHLQLKITERVKCFEKRTTEYGERKNLSSFWETGRTSGLFAPGQMGNSVLRV